jgi:protein-arginine kinase activator protein McsA
LVETEEEKQAEGISDMPSEKLNELLNQALEEEDYEGAAKIRDELNRRN